MPTSFRSNSAPLGQVAIYKEPVAAGGASPVVYLNSDGAGVTVVPGAGATMRVFKSTSPRPDIEADLADASLTYANLIAGTQPTLSRWMLWASGAVTAMASEGPIESAGDVAVIATATGGTGTLEVSG